MQTQWQLHTISTQGNITMLIKQGSTVSHGGGGGGFTQAAAQEHLSSD